MLKSNKSSLRKCFSKHHHVLRWGFLSSSKKKVTVFLSAPFFCFAIFFSLFIIASLFGNSAQAAVDVFLTPTKDVNIVNNRVTYCITIQADQDTKLEALGDFFLVYDLRYLKLVTENVIDHTTHVAWTGEVLNLDLVSGNNGIVHFAKVALHDKMLVTQDAQVKVLSLPFKITTEKKFGVTRLYFTKALAIDEHHQNVLRKRGESFLIRKQSAVDVH